MQFKLSELFIAMTVLAVVVWLARPNVACIADGHFKLSLNFSDQNLSTSEILVAYCWDKREANHAEEFGSSTYEISFRPFEFQADGSPYIDIPHSAKLDSNFREISYHEPEYIVLEMKIAGEVRRQRFPIPAGHGDRSISIDISVVSM